MITKATISKTTLNRVKRKLESLRSPVDRSTAMTMGSMIEAEMKNQISKGVSTVGNSGRMPAYKAQSRPNKNGYPYNTPQFKSGKKKDRPVNLKLTGDFLEALIFKVRQVRGSWVTDVGYFKDSEAKKESGHREGVNGQPSRPTIPTKQEGFSQRIQRIISSIYRRHIRELLKQ